MKQQGTPVLIQFQNTQEDFKELGDAVTAARRPVNSPMQIVILVAVFGAYYFITRYLWIKAGDMDGQMAWINMWIAIVAFGFTWLGISLPSSFRARRFPWLTGRQVVSLSTFLGLIGALLFEHWLNHKFNPKSHADSLTWQTLLPHSIWLTILFYVSCVGAYNHSKSLPRHWQNRPDLHRHQTVDISAQGVVFSDTETRREYHWPAFVKSEETKHLFLLFTSEHIGLMLPKRAYDSAEQLEAMRNLMKLIPKEETRGFAVLPAAKAA
jgi:hypothetical protein